MEDTEVVEEGVDYSIGDVSDGLPWRDRMCPADSELFPFETKALEELEESVQLLAFRLDHFLGNYTLSGT